jgi:hypothetical protein
VKSHSSYQVVGILTLVFSVSSFQPALAAPLAGANASPNMLLSIDDTWPDQMSTYLDGLIVMLMDVRVASTTDIPEKVDSVRSRYHAGGIPAGADPQRGRDLVSSTYKMLQTDPGYLAPDVVKAFSEDLRAMYSDLGGDPAQLSRS